jgi:hypothetical protein
MYKETMKLHLIEEVLRTDNEATLTELETILNRSAEIRKVKPASAHDFVGRWSRKDATLIEKAIKEGCEQINEDDWK